MGFRTGLIILFLAAVAVMAGGAGVHAQDKKEISPADLERVRQSNAKCLECHSEDGLHGLARADVNKEKLAGFLVKPDLFEKSNHGNVECVACHVKGFSEFPHAEADKKQINWCDECHTRQFLRIEDQFFKSVHAKKAEEQPGSFHLRDLPRPARLHQGSPFQHRSCRRPPGQRHMPAMPCLGRSLRPGQPGQAAGPRKHPRLATQHAASLGCGALRVECHTPVPKKVLSHEILPAEKAEKNCVACHSVNSALRVRLYRHLVEEERETVGFVNSVILNEAYVIGATRNRYLDMFFGIAAVVITAGLGLHGLVRIIAGIRRRRRNG